MRLKILGLVAIAAGISFGGAPLQAVEDEECTPYYSTDGDGPPINCWWAGGEVDEGGLTWYLCTDDQPRPFLCDGGGDGLPD